MSQSEPHDTLVTTLVDIHATANVRHQQSRKILLDSLDIEPSVTKCGHQLRLWPYICGGAGLTVAATMLLFWLVAHPTSAQAMEQLVQAMAQVNAYSYHMEKTYVSRRDDGRTLKHSTQGRWRTNPPSLYAAMKIIETTGTNTEIPSAPKTLVDLEEAHQAGQSGILVDHLKREYWKVDEPLNAASIPPDSPQVAVHMIQQRRGRVVNDLGHKQINGQSARGLVITLQNSQPESELGITSPAPKDESSLDWRNMTFEVWIDPSTHLPIEFSCARHGDDFETTCCFTDLVWNPDFGADAFNTLPPASYTEQSR